MATQDIWASVKSEPSQVEMNDLNKRISALMRFIKAREDSRSERIQKMWKEVTARGSESGYLSLDEVVFVANTAVLYSLDERKEDYDLYDRAQKNNWAYYLFS